VLGAAIVGACASETPGRWTLVASTSGLERWTPERSSTEGGFDVPGREMPGLEMPLEMPGLDEVGKLERPALLGSGVDSKASTSSPIDRKRIAGSLRRQRMITAASSGLVGLSG
jgi:hypothetical protein